MNYLYLPCCRRLQASASSSPSGTFCNFDTDKYEDFGKTFVKQDKRKTLICIRVLILHYPGITFELLEYENFKHMKLKHVLGIMTISATTAVASMWGYNKFVQKETYVYNTGAAAGSDVKVPSNYAGFNGLNQLANRLCLVAFRFVVRFELKRH